MSPECGTHIWIHDGCEQGGIWPINRQRAEGILSIHASCEPPCPCKQRAARYLEDLDAGREEDTTLSSHDWRAAR
ncbi:hypothetical protein [Nocardia otitidiscaviarum]|uniref:hypothetical protein n=1 Tax=Nocardia otitidiscaviarum TaxID=1823 RepID=UPI0018941906|nr:hypothetical protein [Nocardia otitidiscaviarum]MBF6181341.1 hypothetical protein [Nocardia otitidiscaviarum]